MLETLAGRLKWERTSDGIRVVIPVRVPWLLTLSGIFLFTFPSSTVDVFSKHRGFTGPVSFIQFWILLGSGICLGVLWFTMIFTIKQVLTLNPAEMTIQVRTLGIGVRKRTVATNRLHYLRFEPSEYGDSASFNNMSRIQIDRDGKTRNFAFGITEQEADALIEKMMEVYKFPKYPKTDTAAPAHLD
jgi:hypothetical protein